MISQIMLTVDLTYKRATSYLLGVALFIIERKEFVVRTFSSKIIVI